MPLRWALLAALLAPFLAASSTAAVVRLPAGLAGYQAALTALNPTNGLLEDPDALIKLRTQRPDLYAPDLLRSYEIATIDALPVSHREAFLRREMIAVQSLPVLQGDADLPAKHRAAYGSKAEAAKLAKAACAWDTLEPAARESLVKEGMDAEQWAMLPLSLRAATIAKYWREIILDGSYEPGSQAHLDALRLYARKGGGYLTDAQATVLSERIYAMERVAKRLSELRALAGTDAKAVDAVAAMAAEDEVKAKALMDRSFGLPPSKVERRFVHDPKDAEQAKALAALAKKLDASFKRLAKGTAAEELLSKAAGRIQVGGVPAGSDGAYQAYGDRLALPADVIDYLLRDQGKQFSDLASDDALVDRLAVMYLPTYVHETTHRLQGRLALKSALTAIEKGRLYGHEDEHEAYLAQELFVLEFAKLHPELAKWARSIPRVEGLWDAKVLRRQKNRVSRLYADVPGGAGRRAMGLVLATEESARAVERLGGIRRELARRENGTSSGPRDPVRLSDLGPDTKLSRMATRLLKRWLWIAESTAESYADEVISYFDQGDARIAALKKRLREARRPAP